MAKHVYKPTEYADILGVYGTNMVKKAVERFMRQLQEKKIIVSSDALKHNFVCWIHGWNSGYVDKENLVFVETKRSWKGLQFAITELSSAKNPRTYIE